MLLDRFIRLLRSNLTGSSSKESGEFYTSTNQQSYQQKESHSPPAHPETTFYAALELPVGASFDEIKRAYKVLMKQYHPDKFHNDPQKQQYAEVVTQKLNEAYSYFEKKYGK